MGETQFTDNSEGFLEKLRKSMIQAAKKVGSMAEGYAKQRCPVDTGLLRNSITYAVGGSLPAATAYSPNQQDKSGKPVAASQGEYIGYAPADEGDRVTVYVGTNVHYAPYQELGHHSPSGGWVPPQAFLRPAMENHTSEYENVIRRTIRDGTGI